MKSQTICLHAMHAVLRAADPRNAMRQSLSFENNALHVENKVVIPNLSRYHQIHLFGAGKASCEMASALLGMEEISHLVSGGLIITKHAHGSADTREVCARFKVRVVDASHPLPCEAGKRAVEEIFAKLEEISSPHTLVIWLASGGGSALTGGLSTFASLEQTRAAFQTLLGTGMPIEEMNTVRKHFCLAHAGRIALRVGRESTMLTLCLSDIIDSPVHSIAGGPTALDPSTVQDARAILAKYFTKQTAPPAILSLMEESRQMLVESPKHLPSNILPPLVLMDNRIALERAKQVCLAEFPQLAHVSILTNKMEGEAKQVGKLLANILLDCDLSTPLLLLLGGETTVTMQNGEGRGGAESRTRSSGRAPTSFPRQRYYCREGRLLALRGHGWHGRAHASGWRHGHTKHFAPSANF